MYIYLLFPATVVACPPENNSARTCLTGDSVQTFLTVLLRYVSFVTPFTHFPTAKDCLLCAENWRLGLFSALAWLWFGPHGRRRNVGRYFAPWPSRGGTNQGFADNGGIVFDNPGAMVNIDGTQMLDIGVDTLLVSGWYSDPQTRIDTMSTFTPLPQISFIEKLADGDWAYGFGVFTPAGFAERFHLIGPDGSPHVYESFRP